MQRSDGMNYAPVSAVKPTPVVKGREFVFSVAALDHGHIYGMCNGLIEAGATIKYVYDPDPDKVLQFLKTYPTAIAVDSLEDLLQDDEARMVAAAAVTADRCPLGIRVMESGKDYFTDKAPLTTLKQLEQARAAVERTGKKYMCYYSERLHTESGVYAGQLIKEGAIGKVVNVLGLGPHRLNKAGRPSWFFEKERYGGILCDIGSHQFEQFLTYSGATNATVTMSHIANYNNPDYPELDDYGDATVVGDNGVTGYFRVDWFTPDGLPTWGDGRTIITGTDGYIEIRKYIDIARDTAGDNIYLVNDKGVQYINVSGKVGFPFFGELILDCINRTENAMTQEHCFMAAKLCVEAQNMAVKVK